MPRLSPGLAFPEPHSEEGGRARHRYLSLWGSDLGQQEGQGLEKTREGPKEGFLEERAFAMGFEERIGVCQTKIRCPKVLKAGFRVYLLSVRILSRGGTQLDEPQFTTSS